MCGTGTRILRAALCLKLKNEKKPQRMLRLFDLEQYK